MNFGLSDKEKIKKNEDEYITRSELDKQSEMINNRIDKITERIDETKDKIHETNSKIIDFSDSLIQISDEINKVIKQSNNKFRFTDTKYEKGKKGIDIWKHYFFASIVVNVILFILLLISLLA